MAGVGQKLGEHIGHAQLQAAGADAGVAGEICRIGETEVRVTQIGKECHNDCAIKKAVGRCVMPTEGIFAIVVKEGTVRAGDEIEVLK